MSKKTKPIVGNMVIGQSGGPTVVINQSLIGAILEARKHKYLFRRVLGARHGVEGILNQDFVDLTNEPKANLVRVGMTPASALGSVRRKPAESDCRDMFDVLQAHNVHYFFYIGGNDTAETAHIVQEVALAHKYDLRVFHIPKTIDNDLRGTDHTPGYGSAAKFVAQAFMGDDLDNRALKGIKINIVMGRNAGFLTAAAALGRARADSGPHLVYVPELAFDEEQFIEDVRKVYEKYGRCIIAASEGLAGKDGQPLASRFIKEVDAYGNKQLSGSGALGDYLSHSIKKGLGHKLRVRADTLGYLQRSFCGIYSKVDADEARRVGELSIGSAVDGQSSGTISIVREQAKDYQVDYKVSALSVVAKHTKSMPRKFMNKAGTNVTQMFMDYATPLIGELPAVGFIEGKSVEKRKIQAG